VYRLSRLARCLFAAGVTAMGSSIQCAIPVTHAGLEQMRSRISTPKRTRVASCTATQRGRVADRAA